MKKIVVTVAYPAGKPATSLPPMDPDELGPLLRDLVWRMSISSEFVGIYLTRADPLKFLPERR